MEESRTGRSENEEEEAAGNNAIKTNASCQFEITDDETDLPALSNTNEIQVVHYLFKLLFDFESRIVHGSEIIFFQATAQVNAKAPLEDQLKTAADEGEEKSSSVSDLLTMKCPNYSEKIVLDSCALNLTNVSYLKRFNQTDYLPSKGYWFKNCDDSDSDKIIDWFSIEPMKQLKYECTKWSVSVHDWCPCAAATNSTGGINEFVDESSIINVIRIDYQTFPETPSLHWRPVEGFKYNFDPENLENYVVYTPGAPVNNRGLLLCQDSSTAAASWECLINVKNPFLPVLSSLEIGKKLKTNEQTEEANADRSTYYFYSPHLMPISTFALVIGTFPYQHTLIDAKIGLGPSGIMKNVRLFSNSPSASVLELNAEIINQFTINLLKITPDLLGPFPFDRLDIVIMPRCFHTLGFSNPYLIFLSPTTLAGSANNLLYYSRLAHELSHYWFGLAIGSLDWTEEWLSEGFATFAEDALYLNAKLAGLDLDSEEYQALRRDIECELELKACVKLLSLQNELAAEATTEMEEEVAGPHPPGNQLLQTLVPEKFGNGGAPAENGIRNGLIPMKQFLQVHYLKGYFFLKHLQQLIGGPDVFLPFLKSYIQAYNGSLVTSKIFLDYYWKWFGSALLLKANNGNGASLSADSLYSDWLLSPELPESLRTVNVLVTLEQEQEPISRSTRETPNPIDFRKCQLSYQKLEQVQGQIFRKTRKISNKDWDASPIKLATHELILLFESILEILNSETCAYSSSEYQLLLASIKSATCFTSVQSVADENPEVLHRWCEILLKIIILQQGESNNSSNPNPTIMMMENSLAFLKQYLLQHPAMGLYLYGELMISEEKLLQDLAKSLFSTQKEVLDPQSLKVLKEMIF